MKRALFFVLLFVIEHNSFCQNLVVNPGFEIWSKTNRPSGWTHVENCLIDSSIVLYGNYSCLHSGGASTTSDLGQTIQVLPGREYRLSLNYKTGINSTGKGSRIWCFWIDTGNNNITDISTDDIMRPSQYLKSETWQLFTIDILAPPEAVAFYLEVRTNSNSITYWDNFRFEENVVTYTSEEKKSEIIIYPNPASDFLIINNLHDLQYIDIQSITGIRLWSSGYSGEQTVTIPVSGMAEGLYIIRIRTSDELFTKKFIKQAD